MYEGRSENWKQAFETEKSNKSEERIQYRNSLCRFIILNLAFLSRAFATSPHSLQRSTTSTTSDRNNIMTIPSPEVCIERHTHRLFPAMNRVRDLLWSLPDWSQSGNRRTSVQPVVEREPSRQEEEEMPQNESRLPQFTLDQVSQHASYDDCWIVIFDRVYDVTDFLREHPGGEYIIMESAGRDATIPFRGTRHGKDSYQMLSKYLIGILPDEERMYTGTLFKSWQS